MAIVASRFFCGARLIGRASALVLCLLLACSVNAQTPSSNPEFAAGAIDESDDAFAARQFAPVYRAFLPVSMDLSANFPNPGTQGGQGSCVGWAVAYTRAYYEISMLGRQAMPANIPSPAYIFNSIHPPSGRRCWGSEIPHALDLLKKGALSLAEAPYDRTSCDVPSPSARERATAFRIDDYLAVNPKSVDQIKGEIARGHPVVFTMPVGKTFERLRGDTIYESVTEDTEGHAMAIVGYDDRRQAFKLINSWGERWGAGGFGWVSYRTFAADARRAYTMRPHLPERPRPPSTPVAESGPPRPVQESPLSPPGPVAERAKPAVPAVQPSRASATPAKLEYEGCGAVDVRSSSDGAIATGFVATTADLDDLKRRAQAAGVARIEVSVRPWPQCEVLSTLQKGLKSTLPPTIRVLRQAPNAVLASGSPFVIEVASPPVNAFLHITYIQADGKAVHLVQSGREPMSPIVANSKLVFGDGRDGGQRFTVSPPFGEEMVVVIASPSPLFPAARPQVETEREFLSALRAVMGGPSSPGGSEKPFSVAYDIVRTVERKP